jgi:hypothetical protein
MTESFTGLDPETMTAEEFVKLAGQAEDQRPR